MIEVLVGIGVITGVFLLMLGFIRAMEDDIPAWLRFMVWALAFWIVVTLLVISAYVIGVAILRGG